MRMHHLPSSLSFSSMGTWLLSVSSSSWFITTEYVLKQLLPISHRTPAPLQVPTTLHTLTTNLHLRIKSQTPRHLYHIHHFFLIKFNVSSSSPSSPPRTNHFLRMYQHNWKRHFVLITAILELTLMKIEILTSSAWSNRTQIMELKSPGKNI